MALPARCGRRRLAPASPNYAGLDGVEDDHRDCECDETQKLGGRKADEQAALLAVGRGRVAQSALKERAENRTHAGSGSADADRREAGTDDLGRFEIHYSTP